MPVLRYYRWFANGGGSGAPNDSMRVEINNGSTTVVVKRLFGTSLNTWVRDTMIISSYIPVTANMQVRFIAGDYPQGHVVEGAVDGFEVLDRGAVGIDNPLVVAGELSIYPNPMGDRGTVRYDLGAGVTSGSFELCDMLGKRVYVQALTETAGQFALKLDLPAGAYMGTLRVDGQAVKTVKVMR